MPIQKQPLNINFGQGLDLKTDPFQVAPGKFLVLENSVFTKGGLLQKRNGFSQLGSLPDSSYSYVNTFNANLIGIGSKVAAYSSSLGSWVTKGSITPISLSTLSVLRSSSNQTFVDSAISSSGLLCAVYKDTNPSTTYNYVVLDSTTGQNVVAPTVLSTPGESPRVFLIGNYFVIVFSQSGNLKYVSIPVNNPTNPSTVQTLATNYSSGASNLNFDGVVFNSALYIAYNATDGAGAIRITYLNANLVRQTSATGVVLTALAGGSCTTLTITADTVKNYLWVAFYNSAVPRVYTAICDQNLNSILTVTTVANLAVSNLTLSASNGSGTILYEVTNTYSYGSSLPSNYLATIPVTSAGVVGSQTTILRSVGLASKAFTISGTNYVLSAYSSVYQPSYFVTDFSGNIVAKLAYSNGGGYLTLGLPSANVIGTTVNIPYLIKDLLVSTNKSQTAASSLPVYTQTGINLASFNFTSSALTSSEIGSNLNISGGMIWAYDGYQTVEQNFHVYPENINAAYNAVSPVTPTGTFASGSTTVTLSSAAGVAVGMAISDTTNPAYIPSGTIITALAGTTATISQATTHSGAADTLSISGSVKAKPDASTNTNAYFYQVTYEWSDNQGNIHRSSPSIPISVTTTGAGTTGNITLNIPTLRLTKKSNVKIGIYRWSVAQQSYYQVTSITSPTLNDPTTDSITYIDYASDAMILGNSLVYTTGGVVENIAPPASNIVSLYKSRFFLVDAEDPNLLWYSKQVIESTPVEMSDLFTLYVAPTISDSSQGNTGPITALSAMDDKLIVFKRDAIYYIVGTGPDNLGNNNDFSEPIYINSTVGCSNPNSIVLMPDGLMFQSDKGIWLLGRDLSTTYIGAAVEDYNSATVVSALSIPKTNQVRFTLSSGTTLMYDYYFRQWSTFVFRGIVPISSALVSSLHTFIDSLGRVFQESVGSYLDGSSPVLMRFQTGWINLAGLQGYQRFYDFYFLGTYFSPHKLAISIAYEYNSSASQQTVISPNNYSAPFGGDSTWGNLSPLGGPVALEQWRIHTQRQTCQSFQITVTEVFDASYGTIAGQGLSLSGIQCRVGLKKGTRPIDAQRTAG